jgi:osomolarity two-component system sensor histidine kinase SLN1
LDLSGALSGGGENALFLQAIVFPRSNATTRDTHGLLNVTGDGANGKVKLPYKYENGSQVFLGDPGPGYPSFLYPNFTYIDGPANVSSIQYDVSAPTNLSKYAIHKQRVLHYDSVLIQGPLYLGETSSLISVTVAINNNTSRSDVLGWLTVVMDARLLYEVVSSPEGLESTGEILIVGPFINDNLFYQSVRGSSAAKNADVIVTFILPPLNNATLGNRHTLRAFPTGADPTGNPDLPFAMAQYPAVRDAWSRQNNKINNAGEMISSTNEEGIKVSVGYAQLSTKLVDWILIFEQSYAEVIGPINDLRDIVLACVFSVIVAVILVSFPLAHYAVKPIRALRAATQRSIEPYNETDESEDSPVSSGQGPHSDEESGLQRNVDSEGHQLNSKLASHGHGLADDAVSGPRSSSIQTVAKKLRFSQVNHLWTTKRKETAHVKTGRIRRNGSRIPQRVPEKRHFIHDELTDLTSTFNEMSDELSVQYSRLEERVKMRTAELEQSRNAAQDANESKTLFVANISHELRTPLNGILGMCAVAIQEKDMISVRQSLKIIYKSGSLLSHLLNDLLTFSRNSFGQSLAIEDAGFRLVDIGTQLMSIFDKQAREAQIDLKVVYSGPENGVYGPGETGLVKDMSLRGDQYRILQVLMNLVSNSLKFTPHKGSVEVRCRCIGFAGEALANTVSGQRIWARATEGLAKETVQQMFVPPLVRAKSRRASSFGMLLDSTVAGGDNQDGHSFSSHTMSGHGTDLLFEFEVEDTGPGVPEHLQQEIFKPFVQGDLALSKKYGGTGLGLAICAQLAILMGGKITLKSTISVGSTFTLCIPLHYLKEQATSVTASLGGPGSTRPGSLVSSLVGRSLYDEPKTPMTPRRDPSPAPTSGYATGDRILDVPRIVGFSQPYLTDYDASQGNNEPSMSAETAKQGLADSKDVKQSSLIKAPRVLVVEDNKVNQQVILRMLRLEKVQGKYSGRDASCSRLTYTTDVTVAQDGQEALDVVKKSMDPNSPHFALVFMDIQMPNMDGIESTKRIRELGFSAPIVALTAFADDSNRQACNNAGMNAFLGKPIKRPSLKQVLEEFGKPILEELTQNGVKQPAAAPTTVQNGIKAADFDLEP